MKAAGKSSVLQGDFASERVHHRARTFQCPDEAVLNYVRPTVGGIEHHAGSCVCGVDKDAILNDGDTIVHIVQVPINLIKPAIKNKPPHRIDLISHRMQIENVFCWVSALNDRIDPFNIKDAAISTDFVRHLINPRWKIERRMTVGDHSSGVSTVLKRSATSNRRFDC